MNETMLVRAAGGAWEELQPRTELPEGGVTDLLGDDVGAVLGASSPVLVAACSPVLPAGSPDAICVDPAGGVWIIQTALDGGGEQLLGELLSFAGGLTGATYERFTELCDRRGSDELAKWVSRSAGDGFDGSSFEAAVGASLAAGRIRLVALVRSASPTLVQSFRYLTAAGALGSIFEVSSFGSSSVMAIRASEVDLLGGGTAPVATTAPTTAGRPADLRPTAPAKASSTDSARRTSRTGPAAAGGAAFVEQTEQFAGEATAALMGQLQTACATCFDDVVHAQDSDGALLRAGIRTPTGVATVVTARPDGTIVLAFDELGELDSSWTIRAELCQGMERLLGADLGDVRQISKLNLSVEEHLMDATLMEALTDLLMDTVGALRSDDRAGAAA